MPQVIDNSVLASFYEDSRRYFADVDSLLEKLTVDMNDGPSLADLHTVASALQQGCLLVGLDDAAGVAQSVVELAAAILSGDIPIDAESVDLFREACHGFRDLVRQSEASSGTTNHGAKKKKPRRELKETVRREDVPPELVDGFLIEASENLALIEEKLREFERDNSLKASLKDARRGVHTIKGAAGMVGLWAMSKVALRMEDLLDEVYEDERAWTPEIHLLVGSSYDAISDLVAQQGHTDGLEARLQRLESQYDALEQQETSGNANGSSAPIRTDIRVPEDEPIGGELQDGFVQEATGLLEGLDVLLSLIYGDPSRKDAIQEVRRRVHTIKGAAGIVGLKALANLAHRMEDVLDHLFDGTLVHDAPIHSLMFATSDLIADMVADGGSAAAHTGRLVELYGKYEALSGAEPASAQKEAAPAGPSEPSAESGSADPSDAVRYVRAPIEKLDEMVRLVGELFVARSVFERSLSGYRREIDELGLTLRRLKRIAQQFESEYAIYSTGVRDLAGERRSLHGADRSEFDALEFDRYTQFHLMSRDLLETSNDIATAESLLSSLAGEFDNSLAKQGRLTADIQNRLMRLRMVPLSMIASRLSRTVRVTSEATGKTVKLAMDGFGVELDKTVLEQLASPLEHLLRNAVDHGIEMPEARRELEKPEQGNVQVVAAYEGTHVVIRIADDGGGISSEKIRAAAVQRGFATEEQVLSMPDKDVLEFLFVPGFSTAATLTEISGRGVGLDIVRSAVESLKGTVSIESEIGAGTCFTVRLPMSLSITKVLMVEANQETFAIPLAAVTQVARVDYGQIETFGSKKVVRHERKLLPAIWLGKILSLPKATVPGARQSMVVIEADGERFGLLVDRIVEARQVMVNPPAGELRKAPVVAGATIMGDGSVVLVLNPVELVTPRTPSAALAKLPPKPPAAQRVAFDVLVVDDSVSVRRVVSNLMRSTGWNPIQAKDGVEALEILQRSTRKPDIILLDVEMPRMDGYEFATTVKGLSAYRKIPIVMLTSRAGDKHRRKAMAIGVNDYLVKPYQDETLVNVIRQWVARTREGVV